MHSLLNRPCWIFDLDGTITRPVHDFDAMRLSLGVPEGTGILEYIAAQSEPEKSRLNQLLIEIERDCAHRTQASEGVVELIQCLHQADRKLAILTRNQRECVDISLQRLGIAHLFDPTMIIASDDAPPKPDPAGIRQLLNHWNVAPESCLIIGDFIYDLQAGFNAGIGTIHYVANRTDRWPQYCDLEISHFDQLTHSLINK